MEFQFLECYTRLFLEGKIPDADIKAVIGKLLEREVGVDGAEQDMPGIETLHITLSGIVRLPVKPLQL